MRTLKDIRIECFEGLINEIKSKKDDEFPVRIAYDYSIKNRDDIFSRQSMYAIRRASDIEASKIYRQLKSETLREIVLESSIELNGIKLEAGTIIPFFGNNLLESPSEITTNQIAYGVLLVLHTITPSMESSEFENDMYKLLKICGNAAVDLVNSYDLFLDIKTEYMRRLREGII